MPLQAVAPFQKSPQVQDVFTLEEAFEEADRLCSCTRTKRIEQKNDMMAWEIVRATASSGKKKILLKSRGLSIMVSGFLCACHGFMSAVIDGVLLKS